MTAISFKEPLHLVQKTLTLGGMLVPALLKAIIKLLEQLLLLGRELDRCFDINMHIQIATFVGTHIGNTLAAQTEYLARLRAFRNCNASLGVHCRHSYLAAQSRSGKGHGQILVQIVALSLEDLVRLDADFHIQVTRWPAICPGLTLTRQPDTLPVVDPGRNIDLKRLGFAYTSAPPGSPDTDRR